MKFTDGYWQIREGVSAHYAVEIRDIQTDADSVTVYAADKKVQRKGDTLNSPLLTIRYSSPLPDVIRVQTVHHKGKAVKGPAFELYAQDPELQIVHTEQGASLTSGKLKVHIPCADAWKIDFEYEGKRLTGNTQRTTAYIKTSDKQAYVREQLDLGIGEYIYGLGERFTPFIKNGQTVDIWNEDGGTCSEQAYKNIPFYLSNRGYGVFVNHPEKVSFEVASEHVSKVQFSVEGESLDYFIIGGETIKDVLNNYTALTGKPALPPAWTFGLWLTTSFTTSYDEETVNHFIDGMILREVPLHVFHFDCFWMKEYQWCDFEWDKDVFPDPEGMLKRLKSKGLKICAWINPYIAQKSPLFDEGMEQGYLVKTKEGDVWQWDKWQAGMGLIDFTNPGAVKWYQGKLKRLVDMGVDSFKTDFGERIPTDVVYFDGSDPQKMHNYYTQLYNKATFELLEASLGKHEAAVFARSATAGGQQFPVHWGGDCSANYASMAETLRGGLSLGLCGFGFWSHDISGFEKTAPPDVYKRWVAFGLLSSHSRLHGNESYRVPWLFGDEAVDVLRYFTQLKCSLMPYLFSASVEATVKGLPVMRAMVLEFPEDPAAHPLDLQYMLGESLLVAPIFNEAGTASYYVPQGIWTNYVTGERVEGGRWITDRHGYFSLPLLARPNSLIAVGSNSLRPDYDYADGVVLHAFELQDQSAAEAQVVSTKGELELTVRAQRSGSTIRVQAIADGGFDQRQASGERASATTGKADGANANEANVDSAGKGAAASSKPWSLILRGVAEIQSVQGADWLATEQGVRLNPVAGATEIIVHLKE
ncbi:alpha-xylosidase [Paenibacillus agricola]|uniref:Alpha-xylosidase n=1 Tax=Paenibacillus agricola TaxID=2716264 RepID=A0ABX0JD19_9BACL|nr:alpha-xylosidase [Paenibacillus agricola]NHN31811.1 alpha-xylosidase [Paenibacillus agricola]